LLRDENSRSITHCLIARRFITILYMYINIMLRCSRGIRLQRDRGMNFRVFKSVTICFHRFLRVSSAIHFHCWKSFVPHVSPDPRVVLSPVPRTYIGNARSRRITGTGKTFKSELASLCTFRHIRRRIDRGVRLSEIDEKTNEYVFIRMCRDTNLIVILCTRYECVCKCLVELQMWLRKRKWSNVRGDFEGVLAHAHENEQARRTVFL